jgi:hypothetical protein
VKLSVKRVVGTRPDASETAHSAVARRHPGEKEKRWRWRVEKKKRWEVSVAVGEHARRRFIMRERAGAQSLRHGIAQ